MFAGRLLFVIFILFFHVSSAQSQEDTEIDFQNNDKIYEMNKHYRYIDHHGKRFLMPYQGISSMPVIKKYNNKSIDEALYISVGPSLHEQKMNDRSELTISHQGDENGFQMDQDRYLSFHVFFDKKKFSSPVKGEIVICQFWQAYKTNPTPPPAFMIASPQQSGVELKLATRSDARKKKSSLLTSNNILISYNSWNYIVIHVRPTGIENSEKRGIIELWINGSRMASDNRYWGYGDTNATKNFDVRVGLYANPQNASHEIALKNIVWGRNSPFTK